MSNALKNQKMLKLQACNFLWMVTLYSSLQKNNDLEDVSEKVIRTEQKVLTSRETRVRGVSTS